VGILNFCETDYKVWTSLDYEEPRTFVQAYEVYRQRYGPMGLFIWDTCILELKDNILSHLNSGMNHGYVKLGPKTKLGGRPIRTFLKNKKGKRPPKPAGLEENLGGQDYAEKLVPAFFKRGEESDQEEAERDFVPVTFFSKDFD